MGSEDVKLVTYLGFVIMGVAQTLPWSCFTNTYGYFMYKLSDNQTMHKYGDTYDKNFYQIFWTSFLGLTINLVQLASGILNLLASNKLSVNMRIYPTLLITSCCFVVTAGMTIYDTSASESGKTIFFVVNLMCAFVSQFGTGVAQGGLFGVAATFPKRYLGALFFGESVAGDFATLLAIAAIGIYTKTENRYEESHPNYNDPEALFTVVYYEKSSLMYFLIAAIVAVITLPIFYFLYNKSSENGKGLTISENDLVIDNEEMTIRSLWADVKFTIKTTTYQSVTIIILFWTTIAVFPAVLQNADSECYKLNETGSLSDSSYCRNFGRTDYFVPVMVFFMVNFSDSAGRYIGNAWQFIKPNQGKLLLGLSFSRIILAGLFYLTRAGVEDDGISFFGSDACFGVMAVLLGITNGYLSSACFLHVPEIVQGKKAEIAGSILPILLSIGLTLGSLTSFATVLAVHS